MGTDINDQIVRTGKMEWRPLMENSVNTEGISVKALRTDEKGQRAPSILLRFDPGACYPYHNHPAGEELFVMQGSCYVNDALLEAGDYLYTPPTFKHSVRTETGCEILFVIPEEVEILG